MTLKPTILLVTLALAPSSALAEGTAKFDQSMQPVLQSYLKIQDALASDKTTGVQAAARAIAAASKKLDAKSVRGEHAKHYQELPAKLAQAAEKVAAASDIKGTREAFKDLSKPMAMWATMSKPKGYVVVFCSMAKGSWVQKKGDVRNPYYGASMLACGEVVGGDDQGQKPGAHADH